MNAIPLINNAPRPNINVGSIGTPSFNPSGASVGGGLAGFGAKLGGSIGSISGNAMRQNPASMPVNNETQLRQEINTSLVALKKEAFSLETLITQAAKTLVDINTRIEELEGKQGDYVKKSDVVDSITSGNMNPVTSNAVANSNAMPVNSVTSGNMHSVTSNAVYTALNTVTTQTVGWKKCHYGSVILAKFGKVVFLSASSDWYELGNGYTYDLFDIPYGFRPIAEIKINESTRAVNVPLIISEGGSSAYCYNYSGAFSYAVNGQYFACWITNQ